MAYSLWRDTQLRDGFAPLKVLFYRGALTHGDREFSDGSGLNGSQRGLAGAKFHVGPRRAATLPGWLPLQAAECRAERIDAARAGPAGPRNERAGRSATETELGKSQAAGARTR